MGLNQLPNSALPFNNLTRGILQARLTLILNQTNVGKLNQQIPPIYGEIWSNLKSEAWMAYKIYRSPYNTRTIYQNIIQIY